MFAKPEAALPDSSAPRRDELAEQWLALHEAAAVVAALAGMPPQPCPAGPDAFPAALRRVGGWRLTLGRQNLADLSAILAGGIKALLAVHAAGAQPRPAALALWQEFAAARAALLALADSGGILAGRTYPLEILPIESMSGKFMPGEILPGEILPGEILHSS